VETMSELVEEHVLCVPRFAFDAAGAFEGASLDIDRYVRLLQTVNLVYVPRAAAETDPTYKQLIPYIIVRTTDNRVLRYQRGTGGGETRLHGRYSIGIGGHIASTDQVDLGQLDYRTALRRELQEEIGHVVVLHECAVAVINDESTAVGQVHLGMVHIVTVENPDAVVAELGAVTNPEFVSIPALMTNLELYENWSQICLTHLSAMLAAA